MQLLYLLAAIGIIILITRKKENEININSDEVPDTINFQYLNSLDFHTRTRINDLLKRFPKSYFLKFFPQFMNLPYELILTVLNNESGSLISKGYANNQIIGDNGKSIGYMQVYKYGAIAQYANDFSMDLETVFNLAFDEFHNFTIGLHYLNRVYSKSITEKIPELIFITLKRYNGGESQTMTSKSTATQYAQKGMIFYNHLKKVLT